MLNRWKNKPHTSAEQLTVKIFKALHHKS